MKGYRVYSQIQQLKEKGFKRAAAARQLGINRRTVERYWDMELEAYESNADRIRRINQLDEYEETILLWLKDYPTMSAAQVCDWLKEHYEADFSERTVCRYVKNLREKYHLKKEENPRDYAAVPELPMGKQMQVDFGEKWMKNTEGNRVKVYAAVFVLSHSRSHHDALFERVNSLWQTIRLIDREKASQLPIRPQTDSSISDVLQYSEELLKIVYADERLQQYPGILEKMHILEETVADTLGNRCISADSEAKIGHKTSDSSFYGYKTHIAMTEERIITAAIVTTGERADGKQLQELIEKSEAAGVDIEEVIGDMAYSERKNQQYTEGKKIRLISKTNKMNT